MTNPWNGLYRRFASEHGIEGQARLVSEWINPDTASGVGQRWAISVVAPGGGILLDELDTDGSFTPCPFDVFLAGVGDNYCPRDPGFSEAVTDPFFIEVARALGVNTVVELLAYRWEGEWPPPEVPPDPTP